MSILLFLLYSFIYLVGLGSLISDFFGVSPFMCFSFKTHEVFLNPFADWLFLFNRFKIGQWSIDSGNNLAIFICFILFFPMWIVLWFLLSRIKFSKILKFIPKTNLSLTPPSTTPMKSSFERPKAMPKGLNFGISLPEQATQEKNPETNTIKEGEQAPETEIEYSNLTDELKVTIRELGLKYGFDMFENVRFENYLVPLVLATDTKALLLTFLTENHEWIADEESSEDGSAPTWFSAEGLITSPIYEMTQAGILLHEKEPDSESIPVVVLTNGSILNIDNLQEAWANVNGRVVFLGETAEDDKLLSLEELLQKENPPQSENKD